MTLSARELFEQAIEILDRTERDDFVSDACAGNEILQEEVEQLLRFHDEEDGVLSEQSLPQQDDSTMDVGQQIDRYQLIRELGEGG
ncbi:MAG: hypothetical protein KDA87_26145, partial [Planctomycetales bacterium]|nr:hypothetical protein [Planctomycetales bacterium]